MNGRDRRSWKSLTLLRQTRLSMSASLAEGQVAGRAIDVPSEAKELRYI
jgi:hypothetical protein